MQQEIANRQYVFIDEGMHPLDEPVAVGPFFTEGDARIAGEDRPVYELWSLALWRDQQDGAS